jgi:2',3'-cyclic-nucleotide 2'-phosphodiesterase
MKQTMRFLCFGDLVGDPGKAMFDKWAQVLKEKHKADVLIVNGENVARNGRGISPQDVDFFKEHMVSAITSGNHIWAQKKIYPILEDEDSILLRPANYPAACPGRGYRIFTIDGLAIAVVSLQGRVFMREDLDCPFRTIDSLLTFLKHRTNIILIDVHAEATSEKKLLGLHLDGRVSMLWGTHTHVPTADEQILPKGTGYISDIGFAGARSSAIGMTKESILSRFLTQMPSLFKVDCQGEMVMNLICVDVDVSTGKATKVERIQVIDNDIAQTLETNKKQ